MTPVEELLRDLVGLLERMRLPYAVMGGLAVRAHGLPRPTYDVDVTISIDHETLPEFIAELDEMGYDVGDEYRGGWVDRVAEMPLIKAKTFVEGRPLVADIFLVENDFQRSFMERRVLGHIDDFKAWLVSPEDLVLLKLVANRPRDQSDVQDVLLIQGTLDEPYLRHWAAQLGVADELEKALSNS